MADLATELRALSASLPIALLPVRIETRFVDGPPATLRIRIYPDEVMADSHQPALTSDEIELGKAFWTEAWSADEVDAWRRLVTVMSAQRAAWVVRACRPTNLENRPAGTPTFPAIEPRARALPTVHARALPSSWIAIGFRGGREVARANSGTVHEPLAMSFRPDVDEHDPSLVRRDELAIERELLWMIDWKSAVDIGMGIELPLSSTDLAQGFDRLIVIGVRTQVAPARATAELGALIDAHHFTRGVALVPQGTPTNNSDEGGSAYPGPDDPAFSHGVELADSALGPDSDATALAHSLGLSASVFAHVDGAARIEQKRARAMNGALWPCTLGYFLEQLMTPTVTAAHVESARDHFARYVRGRGPLPAFRIGRVPYGVLPATTLRRWKPPASVPAIERTFPQLLAMWRTSYLQHRAAIPRIGRTDDPDADLLEVLSVDASAREVRCREVVGAAYVTNMLQLFGQIPSIADAIRKAFVGQILTDAGLPGAWPRIAELTFEDTAPRIGRPLAAATLSEDALLAPNYITSLRSASRMSLLRLLGKRGQPMDGAPLLFYLLRQGALVEYARIATDLAIREGIATAAERIEAELVAVAQREHRQTSWQRLDSPLAASGTSSVGDWLLASSNDVARAPARAYREHLAVLEATPTAELDRLTAETLDTCSHRLDAWITSVATRRLDQLRETTPEGIHLGAFAFVENVRPRSRRASTPGGFIHAPSASHAAAAAILRNAHLSRTGASRDAVAVDLSSARVRKAMQLLDGVRLGQPTGALLGYRFERALHDAQLDLYIAPFRRLYPLARDPAAAPEAATERIAARDVVDGLALRTALHGVDPMPWNDPSKLPSVAVNHRDGVAAALAALDEDVDAAVDLLLAESVYQTVRGNVDRAGATLAGLAGRESLPPPEITAVPRNGTGITMRLAIALGVDTPASSSLRALAEPRLEAWLARCCGSDVRCRVGGHEVTLGDLAIGHLDVLMIVRRGNPAEIDRRIERFARGTLGISPPAIDHTRAQTWPLTTLSFPELVEQVRVFGDLLARSRPLIASDLSPTPVAPALDETELADRANAVLAQLTMIRTELAAALATEAPAALEAALWSASAIVAGAAPTSGSLLDQARIVAAELAARADTAASATGRERLQALVGSELMVLPPFTPSDRPALEAAIAHGPVLVDSDAYATERWIERVGRVREPVAAFRIAALSADVVSRFPIELGIVQLPHVPTATRWVGLPFDRNEPAQRPRAGTCSIAAHRAGDLTTTWAGLLVDEWAESIPAETQLTSYAVHHDAPGSEASQSIVLAVPPPQATTWDLGTLIDIVDETFDLAIVRAMDPDVLPQTLLAPCIYLAANLADDAISTDLRAHLVSEVQILAPE